MTASAQDNENDTPVNAPEERAGVAAPDATADDIAGTNDAAQAQIDKEAAAHERNEAHIEFLKWEELLEQLKAVDPQKYIPSVIDGYLESYKNKLDGLLHGKLFIPKVNDTSAENNGQIFDKLLTDVILYKPEGSTPTFFGNSQKTGWYDIGTKGIFFKAGIDPDTKQKNAFTEAEARSIALLAMHNRNLMPPDSMRVTGTPQQKAMILKEIDELNKHLPSNAQMNVANRDKIDMSLLPKAAEPSATQTGTQSDLATDTSPAASSLALSGLIDALKTGAGNTAPQVNAGAVADAAPAEGAHMEVAADISQTDWTSTDQFVKMQELIDTFDRDDILKHAKVVQETEDGQQAYAGKLRIDDAPKGAYTQVVFTAPEEGERKIISIEKTDVYAGYQSPDIKLKAAEPESSPRDAMHKDFVHAGAGDSSAPDQKDAEKHGPSPSAVPVPGQP